MIELLTVIAIIGILAAILIPVASKVRESSRSAACLSNLHQAGTAIQLYAQDNQGNLPYGYSSGTYWNQIVDAYLNTANPGTKGFASAVLFCSEESVQPQTDTALRRTNYICNPQVMPEQKNATTAHVRMMAIPRPAQVILVADGTVNTVGASDWGFYNQTGWDKNSQSLAGTPLGNQTDAGIARISWRHQGKTQVVFADGHAATYAQGYLLYGNLQISY